MVVEGLFFMDFLEYIFVFIGRLYMRIIKLEFKDFVSLC